MASKISRAKSASRATPSPRRIPWVAVVGAAAVLGAGSAVLVLRPPAAEQTAEAAAPAGAEAGFQQRLAELRARVAARPDSPAELADLARLYHVNGYHDEARAAWLELHRLQPNDARWPYYLADLARTASDPAGIEEWLRKTVEIAPDYAPAWLQLGELAFKAARFEDAERGYRRRLELVAHDPYAAFGLARVKFQTGRRAEGKQAIEELLRATPNFSSAHNFYAEILAQENKTEEAADARWRGTTSGRFRAAEDPWLEELRDWCYDPDQLVVWGEIDLQTKRGDHGRKFLERAVALEPDNSRAFEKLGEFYLEQREPEKARRTLERGKHMPGASESLYLGLCRAYEMLQRTADALRATEDGLAVMPDSSALYSSRGLLLGSMGRFDEAVESMRKSIELAPGSPSAVSSFGLLLLHAGKRDEAIAQFKRALQIQPRFHQALTTLGRLELEAGRPREAANYIRPFFDQFPGSRAARDLMSKLYIGFALEAVRAKNEAAAEQACREGLELVPDSPELHGFLGTFYAHQNRVPEAIASLEASDRLRPNDPRTMLPLAQLYQASGQIENARRLLTRGDAEARRNGQSEAAAQFAELLRRLPR